MNPAFGHPGIPPTWSSSSKDGIGTAYATSSRVWFTLSLGIVTEIYYPTIDRPQIRDAQFLITDGETFFHEERRHLTPTVERNEQDTLGYRITSADPTPLHRYQLVKEVISDPHQACVLIRVNLNIAEAWRGRLKAYFLLAPHLEVGGWNNSAQKLEVAGRTVLLVSKNSTYMAMGCDRGFRRASCGFVGFSDGWQDINDNFQMDWEFDSAENGNVAVMGEIDLTHGGEFTIGIAFGDALHAATAILTQSLAVPFDQHRERYIDQWQRLCTGLDRLQNAAGDGGLLYRTSRNLLHAHEDKTFAGAIIASASIPWGDAMGDEDLGGYHLVWTRDMVNSATALLACGDRVTPLRALIYLACSQQADGGFPQNFWIDGTPYWKGIQLDEVAFPIMLAWRLWKEGALADFNFDPYPMVRSAAAYLIQHGAVTQQERWEEASGYSPSTLAACIAALICAADMMRCRGETEAAVFVEDYADFLETNVERWTVTTDGTLVPGIPRHYIRILPIDIGNPAPIEDPNSGWLTLANRPPGGPFSFPAKEIVDAGFLELVRYGIRKPGTALMEDSLQVIDHELKIETPAGPCWHRYNHDGYGPHDDGKPYAGWGIGRAWPLLTGERAHYELAAGRDIRPLITAIEKFASSSRMLPEQVWDAPDIPAAFMYFGKPCGAAMPLMWAHAEYIKLLRSVQDSWVFDCMAPVADRYLNHRGRHDIDVWKPIRQMSKITAGNMLRVLVPSPFRLRWTTDGWQTSQESASTQSPLDLSYIDIPTQIKQTGTIDFTFTASQAEELRSTTHQIKVG